MKFHLKALMAGMVLCLAGTVGAVFAIDAQGATGTGSGAYDQAINLCWASGEQSITLGAMEHMKTDVPEYRYLSVTPKSTKTVAGKVKLTFTMAITTGAYHVDGVSIKVYETASLATDETVVSLIGTSDPLLSLDKDTLSGNFEFDVTATGSTGAVHETNKYYAVKVNYDGTTVADKTMSGSLTISQSFTAA